MTRGRRAPARTPGRGHPRLTSSILGSIPEAVARNASSAQVASATPARPPISTSRVFSTRSCRTTRPRLAPRATRSPNSRARPRPRESDRFTMFEQPMSRTPKTVACSISSRVPASPRVSWAMRDEQRAGPPAILRRERGGEPGGDRIHRGRGARHGRPLREAPHHPAVHMQPPLLQDRPLAGGQQADRKPHVGPVRIGEARRHDSDYRDDVFTQCESPTHQAPLASEPPAPEIVGDDRDRLTSAAQLLDGESLGRSVACGQRSLKKSGET